MAVVLVRTQTLFTSETLHGAYSCAKPDPRISFFRVLTVSLAGEPEHPGLGGGFGDKCPSTARRQKCARIARRSSECERSLPEKIPVNDEIISRLHLELVAAIELDCIQQMAMGIYCLENLFVLTLGSKGVYLPSRLYRHESHDSPELHGNAAVNEICISYYRRRSCPNGDASDLNLQ
jgi:hypothetical protein